jgi:hypothetical protein
MPAALTEAAQLRATAYSSCCVHQHTNHEWQVKSVLSVLCFRKLLNGVARWQNFCCISYLKLNLEHLNTLLNDALFTKIKKQKFSCCSAKSCRAMPIEIHTVSSSRQRKLKLRRETSVGYESRKCMHAVQGGLLGGHKSTPVRQKHFPLPTNN